MKKLFYTLGIALTFGLVANAASVASKPLPEGMRGVKRQVKAADIPGNYYWSSENRTTGNVYPYQGTLEIFADDKDPDTFWVAGFGYPSSELEAHFDGTRLVIPNQYVYFNTTYNMEVWFSNYTNVKEDMIGGAEYDVVRASDDHPFYFTFVEVGDDLHLWAGDYDGLDADKYNNFEYTDEELAELVCYAGLDMPQDLRAGVFWVAGWAQGTKIELFSFDAEDWAFVGNAKFKDAWFPIFFNGNEPAYDVPLYKDVTNENRFLLMNPYGKDTPFGEADLNESDDAGWIIFNIADPTCVVFEPYVYSGTFKIMGENTRCFCYNTEGQYYYVDEETIARVKALLIRDGYSVSSFDASTRTVNYDNAVLGISGNLAGAFNWGTDFIYSGTIVLPEGYNAGVEGIVADENDAPAEYFDLQGVKVVNPEKGQLVIVRQGTKSSKVIF